MARADQSFEASSVAGSTVVGIDVGGARKGFHSVALRGKTVVERLATPDEAVLAAWCRDLGAELVAVDAPCCWSSGKGGRPAEKALMRDKIFCFSTPTKETAELSTSGFYGWMLCGEALYGELARHGYALAQSADELRHQRRCFETFPHAITVHQHRTLGLDHAVASRKRQERRALLQHYGVDCGPLTSIDWLDAALCALAARWLREGAKPLVYGEAASGLLMVPAGPSEPDR